MLEVPILGPVAVCYARSDNQPRPAVVRVYDPAGKLIATLEYKGDFKQYYPDIFVPLGSGKRE
jgi:hypothetical protein